MIPLADSGTPVGLDTWVLDVVTESKITPGGIFVARQPNDLRDLQPSYFTAVLANAPSAEPFLAAGHRGVFGLRMVSHLSPGDIVLVHPNGRVRTLFRLQSPHNALFVTEQCNSNCLMCSQPPRDQNDLEYFHEVNTRLVRLIPKTTEQLGITGGEPTLLGIQLLELIALLKQELPATQLHMLTNGRAFTQTSLVAAVAKVEHPSLVLGIPLHSDYPPQHDYIAQADHAFVQTVSGLHNLARYEQHVELRIVIHRQNFERLAKLARFIYRNLPFVDHVAFMGLEYVGYTPHNQSLLWIEPTEYAAELLDAVEFLAACDLNVSIYNLPLCLLPRRLWPFCRQSISDWKQEYLEPCRECQVREACGGVFGTSKRQSTHIAPVRD